mgnify:CR=1 FL=1
MEAYSHSSSPPTPLFYSRSYFETGIFLLGYLFYASGGTVFTIYITPLFIDVYEVSWCPDTDTHTERERERACPSVLLTLVDVDAISVTWNSSI